MEKVTSIRLFLFSLLLSHDLSLSCLAEPGDNEENITVTVTGGKSIAKTEETFVCATLDWWPSGKCNYGQCPWGRAGILNLDLNNTILKNAIKAFKPLRIRVGGSMQDRILYQVANVLECPTVNNDTNGLFGFSNGCLTMERWDQLNHLFTQSEAVVTFGLNALIGRRQLPDNAGRNWIYEGEWNPYNARDLIKYTISKGYNVDSWEFGNELSGKGVDARVDAYQYGKDMITLRKHIDELYKNSTKKPKVLGPGGFFDDPKWFEIFLEASGPKVVDGVTHHIYNLGPGSDPDLFQKIQDPVLLDEVAQVYKDLKQIIKSFGPWSSAWVGEAGGAFNSGGKEVSHTFVNSFWYLDQLGMSAALDQKVFCRQTLIGGNYGLLNTSSFVPNPDYYGALLWHKLMGPEVLSTTQSGSPYLRAYSHCSRTKGISVLLINMSNSTTFIVSIADDLNLHSKSENKTLKMPNKMQSHREEYHLSPKDGNLQSDVVLLNGSPLLLTKSLDIPPLKPIQVDASSLIKIAPDSIVFATLPDFKALACPRKIISKPVQHTELTPSPSPSPSPSSNVELQSSVWLPMYIILFCFWMSWARELYFLL